MASDTLQGEFPDRGLYAGEVVYQGVRSPYLESGDRSATEAIVFVHGNPGSAEDWYDLVALAGPLGRALAPTMPGFGQADKPPDFDYTIQGYAHHLEGLLTHLGVHRVHLVLHDFGGPWGLAWAVTHLPRLASLTLINIGLMPGYRWHTAARIWRTPLLGELSYLALTRASFQKALKQGNPRGLPQAFIDRMYRDLDWGTHRAVLRLYRATPNPGAMATPIGELFRQWEGPTLVLWGAADPYVPVHFAEVQRQFFPNAQVVILEDSGHWPYADHPEAVAGVLLPFLQTQWGRASIPPPGP